MGGPASRSMTCRNIAGTSQHTCVGSGSGIVSTPSRPRSMAADGTPGNAFGTAATSACKNNGSPAMRVRGSPGTAGGTAGSGPVRVLRSSSAWPEACVTNVEVCECAAVGEMFSETPQERKDSVRDSACVVEKSLDTSDRPSRPYDWSRGDLRAESSDVPEQLAGSIAHASVQQYSTDLLQLKFVMLLRLTCISRRVSVVQRDMATAATLRCLA